MAGKEAFFIMWLWTLTCDLDLWTWSSYVEAEPPCQLSRSEVIYFKSYCLVSQHTGMCRPYRLL